MEEQTIKIQKTEKRGLYIIMILYLVTWGLLLIDDILIKIISWVSLGLIGFSLWKIIDGLLEERQGGLKNGK